jgi:hypothetical protein
LLLLVLLVAAPMPSRRARGKLSWSKPRQNMAAHACRIAGRMTHWRAIESPMADSGCP